MTDSLQEKVEDLRAEALRTLDEVAGPEDLEQARIEYVGRSRGRLKELMASLKELEGDERRSAGKLVNQLKAQLTEAFAVKKKKLAGGSGGGATADLTLPAARIAVGHLHPLTRTFDMLRVVFGSLGFSCVEGPEVETEHHNFDALNIPADHPSRDSFDTFFLDSGGLLRSHTSPTQIRVMEAGPPPVRVIVPGRVYRPDAVDATHHYCFHQCEGLMVEEDVSFADLKAVLSMAMEGVFGPGTKTRFRPSFFPFTEPSAEVDVSCIFCGGEGEGCRICKGTGWIELLGAGMVDPAVFEAVGYDPERYTGFAFGIGVERLAMLKYQIPDIRMFTENDMRFLEQF
ncbi:MAG: phenylalanine--tRNA ligase subunit alpha [Planctomycetota bacterium]